MSENAILNLIFALTALKSNDLLKFLTCIQHCSFSLKKALVQNICVIFHTFKYFLSAHFKEKNKMCFNVEKCKFVKHVILLIGYSIFATLPLVDLHTTHDPKISDWQFFFATSIYIGLQYIFFLKKKQQLDIKWSRDHQLWFIFALTVLKRLLWHDFM